jgi:hypothetical protein
MPSTEADEHAPHEQLCGPLEGLRDAYASEHDRETQREERDGVPSAPQGRDPRSPPDAGFPLHQRGHDDHVVGVGGVAEAETDPEKQDCEAVHDAALSAPPWARVRDALIGPAPAP